MYGSLFLMTWGSRDGLMGNKVELVGCFVHLRAKEIFFYSLLCLRDRRFVEIRADSYEM